MVCGSLPPATPCVPVSPARGSRACVWVTAPAHLPLSPVSPCPMLEGHRLVCGLLPLPPASLRPHHLHGGAGGPGLVERAPALPAVDGVLHLHAQLPGHCDLVIVLDVL